MYAVSNAFHEAIREGQPQKAMLIFQDCVFTDEDINVENGIQFNDYFNLEEDMAIGQTTSNELLFTLFNDDRLLNDYAFGDFLATIGVLIGEDTYVQQAPVMVITQQATWYGYEEYPYVRRNSTAPSAQPSFAVKSIMSYDGKVWVFSEDGRFAVYNDKTGANITKDNPLNNFMKEKSKRWAGKGIFYNKTSRILFIYEGGYRERYEFCPLGWFTAERPKAPDVIEIDMHCNDFMMKFEKDMPGKKDLGITYPVTLGDLFKKMCTHLGVSYKTAPFINSTAKITKEPKEFETATMRDVLKWIAETACGNARFNRDGVLVIDWLRNTGVVLDENNYEAFTPYWYKTKKITRLCNRGSDGSYNKEKGTGSETYLIQDNPFLSGVS